MKNETGIKTLRGTLTQDQTQIKIYCPHCAAYHCHGWTASTRNPNHYEHRQCHCTDSLHHRAVDSPFWRHGYLIGIDPASIPTAKESENQTSAITAAVTPTANKRNH
ncbi:MAG: hypothetical protein RBR43_06765 [Desulfuromonadaceae bacterium]|nr:hypothetical protein [Desulfuromonadaceae bacterium]